MAPERLRELCRLAIPDPRRDVPDTQARGPQQLCRAGHPDVRQMGAKGRVADLVVRALELAPRCGNASSDIVKLEILGVLGFDDGHGVPQ
jgi:hypothetical protein